MQDPITTTPEVAAPPTPLLKTLSIATTIQIVATSSVLALTAIAPFIAKDLGTPTYLIGYQISLIYASGMLSSAVAGSLVTRYGPVHVEHAALLCFLMGFLGISTGTFTLIFIASLLIGIGYGLNNPASSQMLSEVTPREKRNVIFSIKQSGVPLGGIVASFAFPFIASHSNWQTSLIAGAAATLITVLALASTHPTRHLNRQERPPLRLAFVQEQSFIWKNPKLRTLSWLGFSYSAMQLSVSTFAVISLVHDANWSILSAGSVAAAMQLTGAFGRIFWGTVADRIGGGFRTLALLGLISGLGFASLFFLSSLPAPAQVAIFILLGGASIGWNGVLLAEVAHNAPPGRVGALTGGVLVYTFIGVIVGPSSFAALYALTGHYGTSFLVFSLFGFSGLWLTRHALRRAN